MAHIIAIITETMDVVCLKQDDSSEQNKIQLNFSEYRMLVFLLKNEQNISNRAQLLEEGWPRKFVTENSLNVSIMKLRKKIDELQCDVQIKTYLGKGYKLLYPKDRKIQVFETYADFIDVINANAEKELADGVQSTVDTTGNTSESENVTLTKEKKESLFSNLAPKTRLILIATSMVVLTLLLFLNLYSESFKDFNCADQDVCSPIQRDDL